MLKDDSKIIPHPELLRFFYRIWPSFLLWALDRFLRILRVLAFNPSPLKCQKTSELGLSSLDVLSPNFLRVTVPAPRHFHWLPEQSTFFIFPGQSTFLIFPGISASPRESHPFTIMAIDDGESKLADGKPPADTGRSLVFLVRVRQGLTRRLLDSASTSQSSPLKVVLDGPYSSPPMLVGYGTAILIAGGSGVVFTLPLLLDLLLRSKRSNPACCTRIVFIWAIRDIEHINWISESIRRALQGVPSSVIVHIRAFVTAVADDVQAWDDVSPATSSTSAVNDTGMKAGSSSPVSSSDPQLPDTEIMKVQSGRPNLSKILDEEILCAGGPISVNVCGTHALTNAVRNALRRPRVLRGGSTITLHVEGLWRRAFHDVEGSEMQNTLQTSSAQFSYLHALSPIRPITMLLRYIRRR
ncbi:ferric reductase NAD binding domain-containing protein [Lyophyllum atratum]|nr:ferric reductase NAD binding domain-containing protein [Lyophyllum atratum]